MKISVLMPAYNAQYTIREALNSVLNQTERDWEIVVANDGSTDRTLDVVDSVRSTSLQGAKIRVVDLPHRGCAWATHQGILRCASEIITILDADDMLYSHALGTILRHMRADTCYLWTRFRTSPWEQRHSATMGWAKDLPPTCSSLREAFLTTEWWGASHQRVFRKTHYLRTSGLDQRWQTAVDLQLALLFAATGSPTQSVDSATYWYRRHNTQMSRTQRPAQFSAHREMLHEWRLAQTRGGAVVCAF